jgi:pullulanase/glycogen debranching enzyme
MLLASENSNASRAPCHSESAILIGGRRIAAVFFELPVRQLTDESPLRTSRGKEFGTLAEPISVSILLKHNGLLPYAAKIQPRGRRRDS